MTERATSNPISLKKKKKITLNSTWTGRTEIHFAPGFSSVSVLNALA